MNNNTPMTAWQITMKAHESAAVCAAIVGKPLTDGQYIAVQRLAGSVYNSTKQQGPKCTGHCCAVRVINGVGYPVAHFFAGGR